jgi:hypothetical protein
VCYVKCTVGVLWEMYSRCVMGNGQQVCYVKWTAGVLCEMDSRCVM